MSENLNSILGKEEESSLNFSDLWHLIWDHKWWYLLSLLIVGLSACFYLYYTPETYSSTAKVLVDESNQDATMSNLGVASAGMMKLRGFKNVENEIEAFSSLDYMQKVIERLGLQTTYSELQTLRKRDMASSAPVKLVLAGDNPRTSFSFRLSGGEDGRISISSIKIMDKAVDGTFEGRLGDTLLTSVGYLAVFPTEYIGDFTDDIDVSWMNAASVAKEYCRRLNVSPSGKESSVVVLSFTDSDPQRASDVITTLINVYDDVWLANKNRSVVNTSKFINERLNVIEHDLAAIEDVLRTYKSTNRLTDMRAVSQLYLEESSHYAAKAFEVRNQLSVANFIKDYLNDPCNAMSLIPSDLGIGNTSVDAQISEYNGLVLQRDRLIAGGGTKNPMVADLNASISSVRSAILNSIGNLVSTLELQLSRIQSQETDVLARISSSSGKELQLLSIERQHDIIQELYKFLLQKREENELAALVNVGNTQILQSPGVSVVPVGPNKLLIMCIALFLGLGLPFVFFFLKSRFDTAVKSKNDLGLLSVPFLAEIPRYVKPGGKFRRLCRMKDDDSLTGIIVKQGSRDMMNEAYRVLRTNIDLMIGKGSGSHVIMFTSFNPSDGKTFTVMNIAAGMALKGSKVMLVDLDLRKASVSRTLGISHSGVAAYLNGKSDSFKENVEEVAPGLFVLPVGTLPPNPTELLLSDRFRDMIAQMRGEYDYIFLDCPPVDVVADASIITEYADMSIFVMRANRMDKKVLPEIEKLYRSGKYRHMTIILNCVDMQSDRYGYGSSGYGYGYGN